MLQFWWGDGVRIPLTTGLAHGCSKTTKGLTVPITYMYSKDRTWDKAL